MTTDSSSPLVQVRPLSPNVGAEVSGLDLRQPLDAAVQRQLYDALMQHLVLFFRGQDIAPRDQVAFARGFGRLDVHGRAAFEDVEGIPELSSLENDAQRPPNIDHYHTDGIFGPTPEFASLLRAVDVPDLGGDTIFVSQYATYDALSDGLKRYLEDKVAVNDFMKLHGSPQKARSWERHGAEMEQARRSNPPVRHPMVKTHPVTGRKHLYLSESFTTAILDVPKVESDEILALLFRHCARPEFQYRFSWEKDSMALWDNRATLHYAVADYWPKERHMHRLTIRTDGLGVGDDGPRVSA